MKQSLSAIAAEQQVTVATRSPRLVYVINDGPFFVSHYLPHAVAARAAGYDVHVIVPPSNVTAFIRGLGLIVHDLPLSRSGKAVFGELRSVVALRRLFRKLHPDAVHLITIKPVIYGGIAARMANVPAVVSSVTGLGYVFLAQGFRARLLRRLVRTAYRFAFGCRNFCLLFQNGDDRNLFVHYKLIDTARTAMVRGAGVDTKMFAPTPEPNGVPLVVLPGRLLRDKGVYEFVDAAKLLRADGCAVRFALIGDLDPANPSAIPQTQVEAWQREGAVEWWGRRDDMPVVYAQANIVCLPSYREGLPKALVEAAACGRAIVSTDVPGCREVVDHGENGLLVPAQNAKALAQAIKQLLADPVLRARMGNRGRAKVEVEFSVQAVSRFMLSTYRSLLARAGVPSPQ